MIQPIYKCEIDGKVEYLTKSEYYSKKKDHRHCILGQECGVRMSSDPKTTKTKKEGKIHV